MAAPEYAKWKERVRLRAYFQRHSNPRLVLLWIVLIAGVTGFAASWALLHAGMNPMWLRYPLAVACGYLAFLAQLRLWVEIERRRFDPNQLPPPSEAAKEQPDDFGTWKVPGEGSWMKWLDVVFEVGTVGEGCLVILLIGLVGGALAAVGGLVFSLISIGPELLAEVFLDAVVVTLFYRHLKHAAMEHWLETAVRKTWLKVLVIALIMGAAGAFLSSFAPNSHSAGKALKEIFSGKPPSEH